MTDHSNPSAKGDYEEGSGKRLGRRAMLLGAAAAGTGLVTTIVAGTTPAHAANGDPLLLGGDNDATDATTLTGPFVVVQTDAASSGSVTIGASANNSALDIDPLVPYHLNDSIIGLTASARGNSAIVATGNDAVYEAGGNTYYDPGTAITATNSGSGTTINASITNENNSSPVININNQGSGLSISAVSEGGPGILSFGAGGNGVEGETEHTGAAGVYGFDSSKGGGFGVQGGSLGGTGVSGSGSIGVQGVSDGFGVYGKSTSGVGVHGTTASSSKNALEGVATNSSGGNGVFGSSVAGTGVYGQASGAGHSAVVGSDVSAAGGFGVHGISVAGSGVYGSTTANGRYGVLGADTSSSGGYGISGTSTKGTAVSAASASGTALAVTGVAKFSRSGRVTIAGTAAAPKTSIVVSGVVLTATSLVLPAIQGYIAGIGVAGVVPNVPGSSFTIYLTAAVSTSVNIAWFVVG
jgi:hypothetical protein